MSREKPCLEVREAPHHRNTETENRPERPPQAGPGRGVQKPNENGNSPTQLTRDRGSGVGAGPRCAGAVKGACPASGSAPG